MRKLVNSRWGIFFCSVLWVAGSGCARDPQCENNSEDCANSDSDGTGTDSDSEESGDTCPLGAEGCPCTAGGFCDGALVCLSNLCVDPTGDGDGDPGDGDGDGEPGDGDGDPGDGDGDGDPGDGDGDGDPGDGDGDPGDGDGDPGDGDGDPGEELPKIGDSCNPIFEIFHCVPELDAQAGTPLICSQATMQLEATNLFATVCDGLCPPGSSNPINRCAGYGHPANCLCEPNAPEPCNDDNLGCTGNNYIKLCHQGAVVIGQCNNCTMTPGGYYSCSR